MTLIIAFEETARGAGRWDKNKPEPQIFADYTDFTDYYLWRKLAGVRRK